MNQLFKVWSRSLRYKVQKIYNSVYIFMSKYCMDTTWHDNIEVAEGDGHC